MDKPKKTLLSCEGLLEPLSYDAEGNLLGGFEVLSGEFYNVTNVRCEKSANRSCQNTYCAESTNTVCNNRYCSDVNGGDIQTGGGNVP